VITAEQAGAPQEGSEGQAQEATSEATEAQETTQQENQSEPQGESQGEAVERQNEDASEAQAATSVDDLPDWAQKEIKALRKENQGVRKARKDAEDAQKSEAQKLADEIAEATETNLALTRQVRRSAFIENVGLPNPRAAWGYVLDGTVEVEWDDNHKPSNLDAVRKALKTEDAGLFGNGSADGGARGRNTGAPQNIHVSDLIKHAYENSN